MSHYQSKGDRNEAQLKKGGRTAGAGYQRAGGQAAPLKGGGAGGPSPSGGAPPVQVGQQSFSPAPSPRGGVPGASGNRGGKRTNGPAGSTKGNSGGGGFDHGGNYYKVVPPPFPFQQQPQGQAPLPASSSTQLHPQQQQPHQQSQLSSQQPQPPLQHQQAQDAVARQRMVAIHLSQQPQMMATSQSDHEIPAPSSAPPQSPTSAVGSVPSKTPGVSSRGGLKVALPTSPMSSETPLPAPVAAASPELGRSSQFSFQFGSLSPGFMPMPKIPARTSSAPPNLDEQKLEQARFESARTMQSGKVPAGLPSQQQPKQQAQHQVQQLSQLQLQLQVQQQGQQQSQQQGPQQMQGAPYNGIRPVEQLSESAAQLHHGPMGNSYLLPQQAQQSISPVLPSNEGQLQYSQGPSHLPPQPPHTSARMLSIPPSLQIQTEGLAVPMQGQLPGIPVSPQLFPAQGIGQKGLVQPGMGQMKYNTSMLPPAHLIPPSPIGGQLSPQQLQPHLVHPLGGQMPLGGQLPPNITGNHYGPPHFLHQQRTSKAVKIVHPETHEEIRFDGKGKKGEAYLGNASQGPPSPGLPGRVSANGPQQSRPSGSYPANRVHHYYPPFGPSQPSFYNNVGSKGGVPPGPQINSPTGRYPYPPAPGQPPYAGHASSPLQPALPVGPHGGIGGSAPTPLEVPTSSSQVLTSTAPAAQAYSAPPVGAKIAPTVAAEPQPAQAIAEHPVSSNLKPQIVVTIPESASTTPCSSPVVAFQFGDLESANSPVVSGPAGELPECHSLASAQVSTSAAERDPSLSDEATAVSIGEQVWRPSSGGRASSGRGTGPMKTSLSATSSPKLEPPSPTVLGGVSNQGDKARLDPGKVPGSKEFSRKFSKKEQRQQLRQLQQQNQQRQQSQDQQHDPISIAVSSGSTPETNPGPKPGIERTHSGAHTASTKNRGSQQARSLPDVDSGTPKATVDQLETASLELSQPSLQEEVVQEQRSLVLDGLKEAQDGDSVVTDCAPTSDDSGGWAKLTAQFPPAVHPPTSKDVIIAQVHDSLAVVLSQEVNPSTKSLERDKQEGEEMDVKLDMDVVMSETHLEEVLVTNDERPLGPGVPKSSSSSSSKVLNKDLEEEVEKHGTGDDVCSGFLDVDRQVKQVLSLEVEAGPHASVTPQGTRVQSLGSLSAVYSEEQEQQSHPLDAREGSARLLPSTEEAVSSAGESEATNVEPLGHSILPDGAPSLTKSNSAALQGHSSLSSSLDMPPEESWDLPSLGGGTPDTALTAELAPLEANVTVSLEYANAAESREMGRQWREEKEENGGPSSAREITLEGQDFRNPVAGATVAVLGTSAVAPAQDVGFSDVPPVQELETAASAIPSVPADSKTGAKAGAANPLNNGNLGQSVSGALDLGGRLQGGKQGKEQFSGPHRDGDAPTVHVPPSSHTQSSKAAGHQAGATTAVPEQGAVLLQASVPELKQGSKKKKKKELLAKADAAGTTADLYNAYKAPDEKKTEEVKRTELNGVSGPISEQTIDCAPSSKKPVVKDLDDWEDAAELPTPKATSAPVTSSTLAAATQGGFSTSDERKYTRDFILTFKDFHRELPPLFEFKPDIAEVLLNPHLLAAGFGERDSLPSPGRGLDRQLSSGSRLERRPSMGATGDDDRWVKQSGLVPPPGRGHLDGTPGTAFWPGQGPNNAGLISRMPLGVRPGLVPNQVIGLIPGTGVLPHMIGANPNSGRPNGVDADRWQRAPPAQKGLIPSPRSALPAIHRTENRYEVGKVSDEEESKQRQIKGILNKLTPQNFDKLFAQVKDANIDSASTLTGVISQIFDKALTEPTFCEMYARFCVQLAAELPEFVEEGEKITFKRVLLNKCQEEFERGEQEQKEAESVEEEGEVKVLAEERSERRLKARRRMLGNIRFIGELYKKTMLTERIMHECIKKLLGEYQNPDEEDVEALCNLMSTIGRIIDHQKAKDHIDVYFARMEVLSNNMKLSSRLRFMLKDVIDLRKAGWQERRKVEGPKRIDEVHRDAVQERQAALAQAGRRGPMGTPRGRPAPPEFSRGNSSLYSQQSGALSPVGGSRGSQSAARSTFGQDVRLQDVRMEDRLMMEGRPVPMPLSAKVAEEGSLTLGPQGGLGRGIAGRSQLNNPNRSALGDASGGLVTDRRHGGAPGLGYSVMTSADRGHPVRDDLPPRPSLERSRSNLSDRPLLDRQFSSKEVQALDRSLGDTSSGLLLSSNVLFGPVTPSSYVSSTALAQLSDEELKKKTESTIQEFYSVRDLKEAAQCVEDFKSPKFHSTLVSLWVSDALDRKDVERTLLLSLVLYLWKADPQLLTTDQIIKGFGTVISVLEDTRVDVPKAPEYLATMFGKLLVANVLTLKQIAKLLQQEQESGESIEVRVVLNMFADVLNIVRAEMGETAMCDMYRASGLHIEEFLSSEETRKADEIEIMLQKKQLQCLYPMIPIETHIRDALQRDELPTDIWSWIEKNVQQPMQVQAAFLQLIMTQVLRHCIPQSASSQYDKCRGKLRKYAWLLKRLAAGKANVLEANQRQYILAMQLFANDLGHPPGLMPFLFESFYRDEVISKGAYRKWQDAICDPTPGRDKAIRDVGRWLMDLDQEEGGDEED